MSTTTTTTTNNDDDKQRRRRTTTMTNNDDDVDDDDVDDKEIWGGSNTTISISHGERQRRSETAMSNKTERRSKMTTSTTRLGKGGNIRIQQSALVHWS